LTNPDSTDLASIVANSVQPSD